ncbi:MAG TPA: hypothetical protein VIK95_09335 [Egibacteraceae bacterium]
MGEVTGFRVVRDTYLDSLKLLATTSAMRERDDVAWAAAVMATPVGRERLAEADFPVEQLDGAGANDLVLAVRGGSQDVVDAALEAGVQAAFSGGDADADRSGAQPPPRSIAQAVERLPAANVAVVSVPGPYAALEAHHALTAGLHVLLFSDNVPLAEEVELKERAAQLGLLVMGPGAGTAVLGGTGLGFANVVRRGPVGVVAAAGTGAQEVSALLDRWGVGVSNVIGVGGRDLSADVGGTMAIAAARALAADPDTEAILLVSKPADEAVAGEVLKACGSTPAVAAFLGLDAAGGEGPGGVRLARTLEEGALAAAALVGTEVRVDSDRTREEVARAIARLPAQRRTVRGYYSGGTLCYEAQLLLGELAGDVYSNEPLVADHRLPAPAGAHVLLDLGAEEYTAGRPHPMIDPGARLELLEREARDDDVAVVLLDVVLGHGAHPDPAGQLAPVCEAIMADGGPQVVAYVLGTEEDPQGFAAQRERLRRAGCIVTETGARAACAAAAIATRRPELVDR